MSRTGSRKRHLIYMSRIAFTMALGALAAADAVETRKPNILLILADDLGFSDLGCYGGEIPTPNIDRLAKDGLRFSSFYNSARCCPSRASLMTGLYPHQAGIGDMANSRPDNTEGPAYTGHLLPTCVTMAEVLGDAGYSTWMVGKWHMGTPGPVERGFQNFYGFFQHHSADQWNSSQYVRLPQGTGPELAYGPDNFYATDIFTDYTLEFLKQARQQNKPYFLYLAHSAPHFPLHAPKADIDRNIETYRKGWDVLREARFDRQKTMGLFSADAVLPPRSMVPVDRPDIANGFSGQPNPAWDSLPADRREDLARRMAVYAAMVEHIDAGVGRILADLKAHGELDNTLIFFLSDNGACYEWGPFGFDGQSRKGITKLHTGSGLEQMGQPGSYHAYGSAWAGLCNTPLNMYKHFCHEGGISSPLIICWPERLKKAGDWAQSPAHVMDIMPTVLEAAGTVYPQTRNGQHIMPSEGTSLLAVMDGGTLPERSIAFEHDTARGLRHGKWKITWGKRQLALPGWELYNLDNDRAEQHNLAAEYPELTLQLAAEWESWAKRVGAKPFNKEIRAPEGAKPETPQIAGKPLVIRCDVDTTATDGIILAHGGRECGYALYLKDRHPVFTVRTDEKTAVSITADEVSGKFSLLAVLRADGAMTLSVNGGKASEGKSSGLIPKQPKDGLSIGKDDLSAVGNYKPPHALDGTVTNVKITAD